MQLPVSPFNGFRYTVGPSAPAGGALVKCYGAPCTPKEWADHSMVEWRKQVYATLPGGRVEICRDAIVFDPASDDFRWCVGNGDIPIDAPVVVKIGWNEKDPNGASVTASGPRVAILVSPYTQ